MGRTAKLTISLPEELISFADRVAKEKRISRSKVFATCLREAAEKDRIAQMAAGYTALANELALFADMSLKIAPEVVPEWK